MFTIRNMGGVSLFLFGTTFLWMTPAFATKGVSTKGAWWSATLVLALAVLVGFSAAAWGLFQKSAWWEGLAIGSAVVGVLALVPYWVATQRAGETSGPGLNVVVHLLGSAGVFALLLVPALERWVSMHVAQGR